ncbi:hypothetical protein I7I52_09032 [Histoplasma capsulatum]|uniref:Uncharacterized protein n=1 Tax=Ajellomyces capsulatus TaxID=5037 RepID=A0A8H7YZB6_AJECA|nr:hypothetical protein I7I52_09032 [Histoplasma capsulatum]
MQIQIIYFRRHIVKLNGTFFLSCRCRWREGRTKRLLLVESCLAMRSNVYIYIYIYIYMQLGFFFFFESVVCLVS